MMGQGHTPEEYAIMDRDREQRERLERYGNLVPPARPAAKMEPVDVTNRFDWRGKIAAIRRERLERYE